MLLFPLGLLHIAYGAVTRICLPLVLSADGWLLSTLKMAATGNAFVLGVMPLMLATGAGAGARRSMGTGVVGGMLAATFIATIFIPLFFVIVSRRRKQRT